MGDGYSTNDAKGRKTAMAGPQPQPIILTEGQKKMLEHLARRSTSTQRLARRARIILAAAEGYNNEQIARELRINRETARLWRGVWLDAKAAEHLGALEEVDKKELRRSIEEVLADRPRSGAPPTFTPEQVCQIVAVACEEPQGSGRPVTHWSTPELADEVIKREA